MARNVDIGMLYSRSGSYALISQACRAGVQAAVADLRGAPVSFTLHERDPGGNLDLYAPLCDDLLRQTPARHIFGAITSSSRKEVIPSLERAGGTLWYCVPYEGFESSDHVVYTHSCPNQHLLPLLDWALPAFGRAAYLTGSNYIWGWEMNRLARERITQAGGRVLGERYLPVGAEDVTRMVEEIAALKPDFVLNNLIGASQYRFFAELRGAGLACPVLSCNLTECELPALGAAGEGAFSAGPYFHAEGDRFGSSHEAAAYHSVRKLAELLEAAGEGSEALPLAALLAAVPGAGIDRATHHMAQPVTLARVENGAFRTVWQAPARAADPWLTRPTAPEAPRLRAVT